MLINDFYLNDFAVVSSAYYPLEQLVRPGLTYRGVLLTELPAESVTNFINLINSPIYDTKSIKLFFKENYTYIMYTINHEQLPVPPIFKELSVELAIESQSSSSLKPSNSAFQVLAQQIVYSLLKYPVLLSRPAAVVAILLTVIFVVASVQLVVLIYDRSKLLNTFKTIWKETKQNMETYLTFETTYFFSVWTLRCQLVIQQYIAIDFPDSLNNASERNLQITTATLFCGGVSIPYQIRKRYLD